MLAQKLLPTCRDCIISHDDELEDLLKMRDSGAWK
jgi:hypothetical protein